MKSLKLIVIVMGVMLAAGIVVLAAAIAIRVGHRAAPSPAPVAAQVPLASGDHAFQLPAGAKLLAAQTEGDRVMLRLALAEGGEELLLLDWKTGARLAVIDIRGEAGTAKP